MLIRIPLHCTAAAAVVVVVNVQNAHCQAELFSTYVACTTCEDVVCSEQGAFLAIAPGRTDLAAQYNDDTPVNYTLQGAAVPSTPSPMATSTAMPAPADVRVTSSPTPGSHGGSGGPGGGSGGSGKRARPASTPSAGGSSGGSMKSKKKANVAIAAYVCVSCGIRHASSTVSCNRVRAAQACFVSHCSWAVCLLGFVVGAESQRGVLRARATAGVAEHCDTVPTNRAAGEGCVLCTARLRLRVIRRGGRLPASSVCVHLFPFHASPVPSSSCRWFVLCSAACLHCC